MGNCFSSSQSSPEFTNAHFVKNSSNGQNNIAQTSVEGPRNAKRLMKYQPEGINRINNGTTTGNFSQSYHDASSHSQGPAQASLFSSGKGQ